MREWLKWGVEVAHGDDLSTGFEHALYVAGLEPKGPTLVVTDKDTLARPVRPRSKPSSSTLRLPELPDPPMQEIERIANLLLDSEFSVLVTSSLGSDPSSFEALKELADLVSLSVVEGKFRQHNNFPWSHPMHLGFGSLKKGIQWSAEPLKQADLVMVVESDFPVEVNPDARVVQITKDPSMTRKHFGEAEIRLIGNPASGLRALTAKCKLGLESLSHIASKRRRYESATGWHEKMRQDWMRETSEHLQDNPISPWRIASELDRIRDGRTIYLLEDTAPERIMNIYSRNIRLDNHGSYISERAGFLGWFRGL